MMIQTLLIKSVVNGVNYIMHRINETLERINSSLNKIFLELEKSNKLKEKELEFVKYNTELELKRYYKQRLDDNDFSG